MARPAGCTTAGDVPVGYNDASTSVLELDDALRDLRAHSGDWARLPLARRIELTERLTLDFGAVAQRWVEAGIRHKHIDPESPAASEEWIAGPYFILRNLRLLRRSLRELQSHGSPRIPGPIRIRRDGQVAAQVFPLDRFDRIFYGGVTAEVWMQAGVRAEELAATQATAYRAASPAGKVALVLGAGNVSSIGPMDALYKLLVENQVVLYKLHPVNTYLAALLQEGFRALIEPGFLRVVEGGSEEGAYLCQHPEVDEIHITGSDQTVEAIVFGPGAEGAQRKAERRPRLTKRITSELGNVSPVLVVPGRWSGADLDYQAVNLVSMLANNAGFNCNAARVIIQHRGWPQRGALLTRIRRLLAKLPPRRAYYPGARDRHRRFVSTHPQAERFGVEEAEKLPWTLIPGLEPDDHQGICYSIEAFCSVFCETLIAAPSVSEYIDRAVEFANQRLWGTLNATLLVHPESLRDPEVAAALERAIAELRYGTVSVNHWAAVGFGLAVLPWGAFPGHDIYDIQSGVGVVHNTLMFSRPQKSVVRAPFRVRPTPVWFVSHRRAGALAKRLVAFEAAPSPWKAAGIVCSALRG